MVHYCYISLCPLILFIVDGSTSDSDPVSKAKTEDQDLSKTEANTTTTTTSEDLSDTRSTNQSISIEDSSIVDDGECTKTLDQINPDIMKSIDSMDVIAIDSNVNDNVSNTDSLVVPESSQGGESDQDSKNELNGTKNSDAGLGDLKDHGVVSLHYPEEEDGNINCRENNDNKVVNVYFIRFKYPNILIFTHITVY